MRALRLTLSTMLVLLVGCDCGNPNTSSDGGAGGGGVDGGGAGGGTGSGTGGGTAGGGGGGGGGAGGCVQGATALSISPANPTLAAGATQAFVATATVNGQQVDVTSSVTFSAARDDDSPAGSFSGATFTAASGVGGAVHVTASDGCLSATTDVTVTFTGSIAAGDGGVMSGDFSGTLDTTTASLPRIVYPHDGTRFPRNIYKVLFQWQRAGHSRFRLTFAGAGSTVQVFTDGRSPVCTSATAGCWEADAAAWLAIAGSNAGGEVTLTVDGVDVAGGPVYRGPSITIGFSRRDVKGAIFYWSTTSAGIRRATVSDNAPEPYLVGKPIPSVLDGGAVVQCVACHTVSRSGRKLFAGTKSSTATGLHVYDVTLTPPPTPVITDQISNREKGFGTFSPDDTRVVATVGDRLVEFDSVTAQQIVQLSPARGTNPDWSPLGHELVYSNQGGDSPGTAALAVIARGADGGWGAVRTLVPVTNNQTSLFPSYTPDGLHVAYQRGRGGHGDSTYQLWLIDADGGNNTELLAANRKVNNCLGIACDALGNTNGQYENAMPTWAPPGDLEWVAFNSQRPYGLVSTAGTQQIWVAAVDRSKIGQRLADGGLVDPSYPAFRFAFQDLTENNHRAFWTLDVRVEQDAGVACVPQGQACAANSTCCGGNQCQAISELEYQCLPPGSGFDAGMCLAVGASCSQTSGAACCDSPLIACDAAGDGGFVCQSTIN